jgi:predicted nucleotidyltransferase
MEEIRKQIEAKLQEIEDKESVRIIYAAESGSRAWGVASPDSDYDVRFIYVRPKNDYLALDERRDVIEWQLDEVLDINGWDLKKTLLQFHKGNATLFEWSHSPICYKTSSEWEQIYQMAAPYFSLKAAIYHYYGTALSTYEKFLKGDTINYKKYFYALRPLLAGEYIINHRCPPPVRFDQLLTTEMASGLQAAIAELLAIKKNTVEKALGQPIPVIQNYIVKQIARQKDLVASMTDDRKPEWDDLNRIFLQTLMS